MSSRLFRSDIQGLRAIAVMSVLIFHIAPAKLPGGFIGVDIFFVISGYLIIGQIWRSLENQSFSIVDFYSRRAKRLFPPLIVLIFVSSIVAYWSLLPGEFEAFCHSVIASLLYVSNFWFYTKSGYFDHAVQLSPLLHTWSLSVEEQFYIFMPLILLFCFRRKLNIHYVLIAIFFITLILSEALLSINESLSFYASPSRFWQFLAGGLVSITFRKGIKSKLIRELIVFSSLLILVAGFFFAENVNFPGFQALAPTLATAAIIYACHNNDFSHKLLSNPLAMFFGKISYSLYLWHWPIIIFYRIEVSIELQEPIHKIIVFFISIICGYLSYRLIERRYSKTQTDRGSKRPLIATVAVTLLASTIALSASKESYSNYTAEQLSFADYLNYPASEFREGTCFLTQNSDSFSRYRKDICVEASPGKRNLLLIGDSYAAHWYGALRASLDKDTTLTQVTSTRCKPFIGLTGPARCTELLDWAFNDLLKKHSFERIIVSARWLETDKDELQKTIRLLKNHTKDILVMGPIMEYKSALPRLLATKDQKALMEQGDYISIKKHDSIISKAAINAGAQYISLLSALCKDQSSCHTNVDGVPIQFDYGHLTLKGGIFLFSKIGFWDNHMK